MTNILARIVLVAIVFFAIRLFRGNKGKPSGRPAESAKADHSASDRIRELDPAFHEDDFRSYCGSCLTLWMQAEEAADAEKLMGFSDDEMVAAETDKYAGWKQKEICAHYAEPTILGGELRSFSVMDDREVLLVSMKMTARAWHENAAGEAVSGNRDERTAFRCYMSYWRAAGTKTEAGMDMKADHCPGCGAAVSLDGYCCTHCGREVRTGKVRWMLKELRLKEDGAFTPGDGRQQYSLNGDGGRDSDDVIEEITMLDSSFNWGDMEQFVKDCFLTLQLAWTNRDNSATRSFVSENYFKLNSANIRRLQQNHMINYMIGQQILSVEARDHKTAGDTEVLVIRLHARVIDYTVNDNTGSLLDGSKHDVKDRYYRLEFIRAGGVMTNPKVAPQVRNCPACGAPLKVNAIGECEYCGAAVTNGQHGWVLNAYGRWA